MAPKTEGFALFPQLLLDVHDKLAIDLFAGGGGASSGFEQATGRQVDVAINHDEAAIAMHQINHPQTLHLRSDVFEVDPRMVCQGRPVGFLWASPDCTHHSKARGGKPLRTTKRRALAWVVTRWAGQVRPDVIMAENVEEFAQWGPLVGRPGELRPCKKRRGKTFRRWIRSLRDLGYTVEWRELRACDYGAPTIRKRLYLIARCDGKPIRWPEPSHGPTRATAYRTTAECIDWDIPMCSIFATKEEAKLWALAHGQAAPIRPLAEETMHRIARGVKRYVLDSPKPYLMTLNHGGNWQRAWDIDEPMKTITSARDAHALIAPHLMTNRNAEKPFQGADEPSHTIVADGARLNVVAPYLVPRYGERDGQQPRTRSIQEPAPVVVPSGNGGNLVGVHLSTYHGAKSDTELRGADLGQPIHTIDTQNRYALVASFLGQYNGGFAEGNSGDGHSLDEPMHTATTQDRFGLVTVKIGGEEFVIADIAMRMLQPRELYRCQGFRDGYIIDRGPNGRMLTKAEQVRMVGNSVSPPVAEAMIRANVPEMVVRQPKKGKAVLA